MGLSQKKICEKYNIMLDFNVSVALNSGISDIQCLSLDIFSLCANFPFFFFLVFQKNERNVNPNKCLDSGSNQK